MVLVSLNVAMVPASMNPKFVTMISTAPEHTLMNRNVVNISNKDTNTKLKVLQIKF